MNITKKFLKKIVIESIEKNLSGPNLGISIQKIISDIVSDLKQKKVNPLTKAKVKHLFRFYTQGTKEESLFAKRWIESLYSSNPAFQKIVDSDFWMQSNTKNIINPPEFSDFDYPESYPTFSHTVNVGETQVPYDLAPEEYLKRKKEIKKILKQFPYWETWEGRGQLTNALQAMGFYEADIKKIFDETIGKGSIDAMSGQGTIDWRSSSQPHRRRYYDTGAELSLDPKAGEKWLEKAKLEKKRYDEFIERLIASQEK